MEKDSPRASMNESRRGVERFGMLDKSKDTEKESGLIAVPC